MCPIAKDVCIEEKCAWYVEKLSNCSLPILAEAVKEMKKNED